MKKLIPVISIVMVILMITAVSVSANRFFSTAVGGVSVKNGTPVIDGSISNEEGWTGPINFDKTKYGTAGTSHSDYEFSGGLYFASDANGFYFAAMLNDNFDLHIQNEVQDAEGNFYYETDEKFHNGFVESTMETTSGAIDDYDSGFNGDVFILQLDPLNWFAQNGYNDNSDYTAWYNVAILNGAAAINRIKWNTGAIEGAAVAGAADTNGWHFEAYIPWSEIANDCKAASGGDFAPTVEELAAASKGNMFSSGFADRANPDQTWTSAELIYVDRYNDVDTGEVKAWQRYCTMAASINGIQGEMSDGVSVKCCGIYLKLGADQGGVIDGTGGDAKNGTNAVTNTDATVTEVSQSGGTTTTNTTTSSGGSSSAKSSTASDGSAQTFDPGIAVAAVAALGAGAGVVITKKRFK